MMTLRLVKQWHTKFQSGYKSLTLALNYLENCKRIEWDAAQRPVEDSTPSQAEITNRRFRENIQVERAHRSVSVVHLRLGINREILNLFAVRLCNAAQSKYYI